MTWWNIRNDAYDFSLLTPRHDCMHPTHRHVTKIDNGPADILRHTWYSIQQDFAQQDENNVDGPRPCSSTIKTIFIAPRKLTRCVDPRSILVRTHT